ncbi:MAG: hydrolase TatD [Sandaracinus sp.]|nr:hydrolase TatD [Sandaracinus sp.]|tara:strand:+ start:3648 stop:4439 length:792 start_codon:yes stop_codon:yes gene_type:complete
MRLFDTHCHLDDRRLEGRLDEVLQNAADAGVERMTTIGCVRDVEGLDRAPALARRHAHLSATVGVHPHDAAALDDALFAALETKAAAPEVVAIGEMGLDYFYDNSPRETQQEVFRRQIDLAKRVGKPIVVHTRDAAAETLAILRAEDARDVGGIIHCFSEDAAFAKAALEMGFVAAFSGIVTFKRSAAIQEAAKQQPGDMLLVETDAPYLAPVPKRGKTNEPAYVAHTARFIAELRGEDPEELAERAFQNSLRVFGIDDATSA